MWKSGEGGAWLMFSYLIFLHHPPTAWIASLVAIYPNWVCGERRSYTRIGRPDILLACLAGCFLGISESMIFRVLPSGGTAGMIGAVVASFDGVVTARSRESPCKWRVIRAVFLVAWTVSYWLGHSLPM